MIFDYYQKNPSASQALKGSLYEQKIIDLIKSKMKIHNKEIETLEAEKIIIAFNKPHLDKNQSKKTKI